MARPQRERTRSVGRGGRRRTARDESGVGERRRALRHPRRRDLYAMIRDRPGIHLRALSRELGIGLGVLRGHLRVLRRDGLVLSRRSGRRRVYSVPSYAGPAGRSRGEMVLAEITRHQGVTVSELAGRIGVSRMLAHYHVRRLRERGTVRAQRDGRTVRLYLRASARAHDALWARIRTRRE